MNSNFMEIETTETTELHFREARTKEELERCYEIVYYEWEKAGYLSGGTPLRYSLYNALPQTTTFAGIKNGKIFMTATIIPDSQIGMPIDIIFHDKLSDYRNNNKKIAEVSMLAFDSIGTEGGKNVSMQRMVTLMQMFNTIFSYARCQKIDMLCVKVHPKHADSYERLLFKDFGDTRDNPLVKNMPVTGKILDISEVTNFCLNQEQTNTFPCNLFFNSSVSKTLDKEVSAKYIFTPQDLRYFFIDKQPIFKNLSLTQRDYLKSLYPETEYSAIFNENIV